MVNLEEDGEFGYLIQLDVISTSHRPTPRLPRCRRASGSIQLRHVWRDSRPF